MRKAGLILQIIGFGIMCFVAVILFALASVEDAISDAAYNFFFYVWPAILIIDGVVGIVLASITLKTNNKGMLMAVSIIALCSIVLFVGFLLLLPGGVLGLCFLSENQEHKPRNPLPSQSNEW